jgi:iron complex outermembrane receptor protein
MATKSVNIEGEDGMAVNRKSFARRLSPCGVSLAVLACAAPVAAQTTAQAAPSAQETKLPEIVVTAQRREESSQKISLALSVLSGQELVKAGVTDASALSNLVPGVKISFEGAQAQVYVRGVGTFAANSLAEGSVAFNIDGVYLSRPSGVGGMFFDIDRIEVLKGPQGTLYGRNASAGAVNVVTKNPRLGLFTGDLSASAGNYNAYSAEAAVNVPVGDKLAFRAAFQTAKHDGYLSDGTNDQNQTSGRVKILYQPNDVVKLLVAADYASIGGKGPGAADYPALVSGNPWVGLTDPRSNAVLVAGSIGALTARGAPLAVATPLGGLAALKPIDHLNYKPWGVSANLDVNLGFATLTLLPAYRDTKGDYYSNTGGFGFGDSEDSKTTTFEARLANSGPGYNWVVGAYSFNEHMTYDSVVAALPFISSTNHVSKLDDNTWAVFGQGSKELLPHLRLIGGLRYTDEHKAVAGSRVDFNSAGVGRPGVFAGEHSWTASNYKAGVEYDVAPQSMLYGTVSTGFKAGGFTIAGSSILVFNPEQLTSYEIGSKNRFFDNRLQLNASAYYWDYKNHQEPHLGPGPGGTVTFLTSNAGKATIKGVDFSAIYKLTADDTLNLDLEYNDTQYNSFSYDVNAGFANAQTTGCKIGPTHTSVIDSTNVAVNSVDCSGFQLAKAPAWSGTVGYAHVFELSNGGRLTSAVNTHFSSQIWGGVDFIANEHLPAYNQTNFDLTYDAPGRAWSVTAFVKNIENSAAYTNSFEAQFVAGLVHASILAPQTYGVRVAAHF